MSHFDQFGLNYCQAMAIEDCQIHVYHLIPWLHTASTNVNKKWIKICCITKTQGPIFSKMVVQSV